MTQVYEQHKQTIIKLVTPIALKMKEPLEWLLSQIQDDLTSSPHDIEEYIKNVIQKEMLGFNHSSFCISRILIVINRHVNSNNLCVVILSIFESYH